MTQLALRLIDIGYTEHAQSVDLTGLAPESWCCVDCGVNTAPGMFSRVELEKAFEADKHDQGVAQTINRESEVYTVRDEVWKATGLESYGGCLCIGCLEKRIGRKLRPKDFQRDHPFNFVSATPRLLKRQKRRVA